MQALVPVAKLNSQDLWGVVLLAEAEDRNEDEDNKDAKQDRSIYGIRMTWKYHHLTVVPEEALIAGQSWKYVSGCCPLAAAALSPQQQQWTSLHPSSCHRDLTLQSAGAKNKEEEGEEDVDDSDDDYWGQYGDAEDLSTDETAPDDSAEHSSRGSGSAPKRSAEKDENGDEDEDDDDDYWCKYGAQEHDQEEESESDGPSHQDSSSEETTKPEAAMIDSMGNIGQVDAITLSILLERLITHSDEESVPRILAGRDNDASGSTDNEADNDDYFEMEEDEEDVSLHLIGERVEGTGVEAEPAAEEFKSLRPRGDASSSADSGSWSPSQSTSFVSCASTGTNTAGESASTPSMVSHKPNLPSSSSLPSISPLSTISCTDSAYQEDPEDPFNKILTSLESDVRLTDTTAASQTTPQESVRLALQMAVRKAAVSGMSKTDLFEMLDVIYEGPSLQA